MPSATRIRRALISVYDKTGIVEFARALHDEFGVEIISTGGTAKALTEAGIPVTLVEDITGFGEMLDGRVKTLHPKIHAAILADRDNPEHMRQLAEAGIEPIDMVVVNLYPFEKTVAAPGCTLEQAIEMVDIGGVALLRAAAKNHKHVWVVGERGLISRVLDVLRSSDAERVEYLRRMYAWLAYSLTCDYDASIARFLNEETLRRAGVPAPAPLVHDLVFELHKLGDFRYGENPHQRAAGYRRDAEPVALRPLDLVSREQLSYNNLVDADAALLLCAELTRSGRGATLSFAPTSTEDRSAKLCFAETQPRPSPTPPRTAPTDARLAPVAGEQRSRRNLPHWRLPGATFSVTFASRIGELTAEERDITLAALRFWDGKRLDLHAAVVMPDHVHALLTPRERPDRPGAFENLSKLLKGIKSFSGREISKRRGNVGQVWVRESYDHWIRDAEEFREKWEYITQNVVKEGLAAAPPEYRWWFAVDYFGLGIGRDVGPQTPVPAVLGGPDSGKAELCATKLTEEGKAELCDTKPTEEGEAELCATKLTEEGKAELCATNVTEGGKAELCATNVTEEGKAELCDTKPTEEGKAELCATRRTEVGTAEPVEPVGRAGTLAAETPAVCCFIKHTNACGVGVAVAAGSSLAERHAARLDAYRRAYLGDPNAAMGGILACNFDVDAEFAAAVMQTYDRFGKPLKESGAPNAPGGFFVEVWIAPSFTEDAVAVIRGTYVAERARERLAEPPPQKKWGANARLLAVGDPSAAQDANALQFRSIAGGMLAQTADAVGLNEEQWRVVTKRAPTERERTDLRLAWLICKHTKSNAICLVRDGMLIGNGAGQMSRVMSCRVATWLARENGHLPVMGDWSPTGQNLGDRSPTGLSEEQSWRRHLPHIERPEASYFVTFRVRAGQLAPHERDLILNACRFWHGSKMTLHAACVMPDHVHLLLTPFEARAERWVPLAELLKSIKGFSALQINRMRGRSGPFWMDENFDRIIRNAQDFAEKWDYMWHNPVTAGLVGRPEDYPWFWSSQIGFGDLAEEKDRSETGPPGEGQKDRSETGPPEQRQKDRSETGPPGEGQKDRSETGPPGEGQKDRSETGPSEGGENRAVAASDAFFPFRDGPDILIDAGVTAIIQPGGSKRDAEVIEACDARGVAMIFTGTRHFRH